MALRTVGVRLAAEISGYTASMRQASRSTKDFVGELDQAARAGKLDAVADQAGRVGLALVGVAGTAVAMAARFDKAMSSVQAATHASGAELEQLRAAAVQAGKDTAYSATEAAGAIEELAKAGVSTADILGGGLSGALSLAAAGQIDVADAAEIAASALTQFQLKGSDVGHVADLLAAGAGKAQGSVHDLSMALSQGGLVAAQMGLSVEDTTGVLAAFASAGLMGSDAGTSLKTALLMLANPSGESRRLMDELGISAYDAAGNFVGMSNLAGQLRSRLGHLTQEQRNQAMATIFGSDAIRAASILYTEGSDGVAEWTRKVNDSGYAAETARLKTDNLVGDLERLRGELETLAIESGSGANSGLRVLAQSLEAVVAQFGSLSPAIGGTAVVLAGVTGAVLLMAAAWVKGRRAMADALTELRATGPAGTRAAQGLEVASKWAGRVAVGFVALELAAATLRATVGQDLNPQVEALAKGLQDWERSGKRGGEAARLLGKDFEHLSYDLGTLDGGFWAGLGNGVAGFVESLTGLGSVADESLEHARERLAAIDSALAQMVQSGNGDQAAAIFAKLAAEAKEQGVNVDELRAGLPGYAAAVETAGGASATAAGQVGAVGDAAGRTAEEVEELKEAFDELFGIQMDIDEATISYHQGLADLNEELRSGTKSLSVNTAEGRKNRGALLDQVGEIKNLRDARIADGMAVDVANRKYDQQLVQLVKLARQLGYDEREVRDLISAYRDIPGRVDTKIRANTRAAQSQVQRYQSWLRSVNLDRTATITQRVVAERNTARGGVREFSGYSAGGRVRGDGPRGVDSVPALLAPDERVLSVSQVDRLGGHAAIDQMLSGSKGWQQAPRYVAAPAAARSAPVQVGLRVSAAPGLAAEVLRHLSIEVHGAHGGDIQRAVSAVA